MAEGKDQEPTEESEPVSGDPEIASTDESESVAPASDDEESSEQELRELEDRYHSSPGHDESDDDFDGEGDDDRDGDSELVGAGAPVGSRSAGGTVEGRSAGQASGRSKKTEATPRQSRVATQKRTTPAQFVREAVGELRKVVYPTGSQLGNYFVVVLVFVLFMIGIVSGVDLALGALIFKIFA